MKLIVARTYLVTWEIDIEADSPREAAEKALRIQRDPESIATVFAVTESGHEDGGSFVRTTEFDLTPEATA